MSNGDTSKRGLPGCHPAGPSWHREGVQAILSWSSRSCFGQKSENDGERSCLNLQPSFLRWREAKLSSQRVPSALVPTAPLPPKSPLRLHLGPLPSRQASPRKQIRLPGVCTPHGGGWRQARLLAREWKWRPEEPETSAAAPVEHAPGVAKLLFLVLVKHSGIKALFTIFLKMLISQQEFVTT